MVAAFPLDIFVFLSLSCTSEVYLHGWNFLEGCPSQDEVHFTDIRQAEEDDSLGLVPLNISLFVHLLWGFLKRFILLGRTLVSNQGLRSNVTVQVFAPHNSPSKFYFFYLVRGEKI